MGLAWLTRSGGHGRSVEEGHRAIRTAALLSPPRRNLADLLASMPDVGRDEDFERLPEAEGDTDVFG